jgi:HD-GYP domain-containing protein (c-di-GMP phosphodiesterase class II)
MMRDQRGAHFDPDVLDLFLDAMEKVEEIRIGYQNRAESSASFG